MRRVETSGLIKTGEQIKLGRARAEGAKLTEESGTGRTESKLNTNFVENKHESKPPNRKLTLTIVS